MKKIIIILLSIHVLPILSSCTNNTTENLTRIKISEDWQFQNPDENHWYPASIPGCVHSDLIHNKLIDDPYYRTNALNVQWVDTVDWVYSADFTVPIEIFSKENIQLVFNCVDTYADIFLNDSLLLSTDNYFLQWTADCKQLLKPGSNNLRVHFYAAKRIGLERLNNSDHPMKWLPSDQELTGALNEKKMNAFTRKPGYQFGWDWTDRFVSVGLREPVFLEAWDAARIQNVQIIQQHIDETSAQINSILEIDSNNDTAAELVVTNVTDNQELLRQDVSLHQGQNTVQIPFNIQQPKLWWPNGLGDPHLYKLSFKLLIDGKTAFDYKDRIGIRTVRLVRKPDSLGTSFYFELNGVPVFMKGANYIPNDNFLDRFTDEKYRKTIQDAVDANMNMLRIWGGGLYEKDIFYDLCDENGILVWQDFMFGGGIYPAKGRYLESVKDEVKYQVTRLRNHPCIALWCGNNETYEALDHWGWDAPFSKKEYASIWDDYYRLFNNVIPKVQKEYDPTRDYWPSSPLSDWDKVSQWDGYEGDIHYWEIWFFNAPFDKVNIRHGRFNSEFGFQSFPEMRTIKEFSIPEDWDLNSKVMNHRQKSYVGNQQIKTYMEMYYKYPSKFENFVYLSQVLQAFGVKTGIEIQRKHMPVCMGSLYWQFNDCWPAISWSSIDYYLRWKALHYFVKQAFKPVIVFPELQDDQVNIHIISDKLEQQKATLNIDLMDFTGNVLWSKQQDITINPNTSQACFTIPQDSLLGLHPKGTVLLLAEISSLNETIDQGILYFTLPKDLELPKTKIDFELDKSGDMYTIKLNSKMLCKNVYLNLDNGDGFFSDNYFDLLPGITKIITLKAEQPIGLENIEYITLREGMEID